MARSKNPRAARERVNWRVYAAGPTKALAVEPGGDHEWVFEGSATTLDDAIAFAAAKLRGD
ncbi:hypothetical protein SEA_SERENDIPITOUS_72 [Mycobacterium phage Serendipitous]|uniref:Uncharacterized protein n=1 Tax=Mycobacterium phage Serendipitous TaxID=2301619 RepID=A0A385UIF2_9CAUD|nr:hypothetical protein I5G64_gp72 [Mycobacterium phage Serendipitous]AYB70613.1 hypothetical protein SEA_SERENDIPITOUS_72 [Mycobacterium phage Serendipitous]